MWARDNNTANFTTGAPFTPFQADLLAPFVARYGADPLGVTVTRIRGIMGVTVSTGTVGQLARIGIRVGAEGEVASTEFNPAVNGEYLDWMLFEPFLSLPGSTTDVRVGTDIVSRVIDVKSMRKLDELDQTLFLYCGTDGATVQTANVFYDISIGLMLP